MQQPKKIKRPDTPLANTPEPQYSAQYMAQRESDNKILRNNREKAEQDKAAIIKQSTDNEAEKEKAYNQQRNSQSSDAANNAAKDAQKSESSSTSQRTNSSLLNRR
jgi:hypothetical protein